MQATSQVCENQVNCDRITIRHGQVVEALKSGERKALELIEIINELYAIETEAQETGLQRSAAQLLPIRQMPADLQTTQGPL